MELFKNTHDALRFAFSYSMGQYGQTPLARLIGGDVGSGRGLVGKDGAAQSGLIRGRLDDALSELNFAILLARYAPPRLSCGCRATCCSGYKQNPEWAAAVDVLTAYSATVLAGCLSHRQLRRFLVERYFDGTDSTLETVAKRCNVNRDTASAHNAKIVEFLRGKKGKSGTRGQEDRAFQEADNALRGCGLVGEEAA